MPLPPSKAQRSLLLAYRKYRDQEGPPIAQLLGWPSLCYLGGIALIGIAALLGQSPWFAALFLGWAAGSLYVRVMNARRVIKAWPSIAEIVDWERVGRLLGEEGRSPPVA
jgi:hypothetical protein